MDVEVVDHSELLPFQQDAKPAVLIRFLISPFGMLLPLLQMLLSPLCLSRNGSVSDKWRAVGHGVRGLFSGPEVWVWVYGGLSRVLKLGEGGVGSANDGGWHRNMAHGAWKWGDHRTRAWMLIIPMETSRTCLPHSQPRSRTKVNSLTQQAANTLTSFSSLHHKNGRISCNCRSSKIASLTPSSQ